MTSDLPESAGLSREDGGRHAPPVARAPVGATPGRVPWRAVGAGVAAVGTPLGFTVLHPLLGAIAAITEMVAILIVLGTALFGSQTLSERAFRLLRWLGNRPEPPGPSEQTAAAH
jgi:hypothetical protein